jgi:PAS domain S-box-containing protein
MSSRQLAYAAPLALSVLICAIVFVLVWRRRGRSSAVRAFARCVLGQVLWGCGYLVELATPTLEGKIAADILQVFPAYLAGLETFRFADLYTEARLVTSRRGLLGLWALPGLHLAFAYTTPFHEVLYHDARLIRGDVFDALVYSFTPLDLAGYMYLALLSLAGIALLFAAVVRQRAVFRAQLLPVAMALMLPLFSALLLVSGVTVLGQRDSAPYAFALSSVVISHTLLRRRLFDLQPIANETVIAATPEAVLVIDDADRIIDGNPALRRLVAPDCELVGETLAAAVPWAVRALGSSVTHPVDIELGPEQVLEARSAPLHTAGGDVLGRVLTFQDVTLTRRAAKQLQLQNQALEQRVQARTQELELANAELKAQIADREQAERQLEASRKQLTDVLDQAFQLMGMLDLDGTVLHANRTSLAMIGAELSDVVGRKFWDTPWWAHSEADRNTLRNAVAEAARGRLVRFSTTHRSTTGELRHIDFSVKPVLNAHGAATLLVPEGRDVTELQQANAQKHALEQQLAQAQKLDSLGRLAGGVAHDFNNLLTAILGNAELARTELEVGSPLWTYLSEILHAGESAKALVQQLLVFTRKPAAEASSVELCACIETTQRMLARVLGENVAIVSRLWREPIFVRVDARQLEQVLVNLAVNARDAMPEGGQLRITVDLVGEGTGARARLRVQDTGTGMSKEVKERIFEPFFTTKPAGKGTGLGLALVFAVVRQAGGEISVATEPGSGTEFTIELPVSSADMESGPSPPLERPGGGRETILLVEDQAELSRFAQRALMRLGYTVHSFAAAEELLESLERVPRADLLLSDVVLPGVSGPILAERLTQAQPWLRVLFASGYHELSLGQTASQLSGRHVLSKPYSIDDLARAVRETLDS